MMKPCPLSPGIWVPSLSRLSWPTSCLSQAGAHQARPLFSSQEIRLTRAFAGVSVCAWDPTKIRGAEGKGTSLVVLQRGYIQGEQTAAEDQALTKMGIAVGISGRRARQESDLQSTDELIKLRFHGIRFFGSIQRAPRGQLGASKCLLTGSRYVTGGLPCFYPAKRER